jgi:hypothetical protein
METSKQCGGEISWRWRHNIAQAYPANEPAVPGKDDVPPGQTCLEDWSSRHCPTSLKSAPVSVQELEVLLDITQLAPQGPKEGMTVGHWAAETTCLHLPEKWEQYRTPAKQRDAVLDLMARRGVFDQLLLSERIQALAASGSLVASREQALAVKDAMSSINISWYGIWARNPKHELARVDAAIQRVCPDNERLKTVLRRWNLDQAFSAVSEDYLEDPIPRVKTGLAADPALRDFLGWRAEEDIARLNADGVSDFDRKDERVAGVLRAMWQSLVLGYTPVGHEPADTREACMGLVANLRGNTLADERGQDMILDLLERLGAPIGPAQVGLLDKLLAKEAQGENCVRWAHLAERLVEAGATPQEVPRDVDPQANQTLGDRVAIALARRALGEIAAGQTGAVAQVRREPGKLKM